MFNSFSFYQNQEILQLGYRHHKPMQAHAVTGPRDEE